MKNTIKLIIASFLIVGVFSCNEQQKSKNEEIKFDFEQIYALGFKGDMSVILELLDSVNNKDLTNEQISLKEKYYKRFREQNEKYDCETNDSLVINIVEIFHSYWRTVLLDDKVIENADTALKNKLADLLYENYISNEISRDSLIENLYNYLPEALKQKGYYSNAMGKTAKFYDLHLWTKETEKIYEINLPETKVEVKVIFMEDFISTGWLDYMSFGEFYAGGWALKDALYCVKKSYDISSESFHVSYLTHEAQHFADYKSFPLLEQPDLEYRAKLTELCMAKETAYELISKFIRGADKKTKEYAHQFANYCIIRDLSKEIYNQEFITDTTEWKKISYKEINNASIKLIKQNTANLNILGAETVTALIK